MTPAALETARRLAAHPRWMWRPGVLVAELPGENAYRLTEAGYSTGSVGDVPDLDDPATCGVLLAEIVTAGCHVHHLAVLPLGAVVVVERADGLMVEERAPTLGEALALALLALRGPG